MAAIKPYASAKLRWTLLVKLGHMEFHAMHAALLHSFTSFVIQDWVLSRYA